MEKQKNNTHCMYHHNILTGELDEQSTTDYSTCESIVNAPIIRHTLFGNKIFRSMDGQTENQHKLPQLAMYRHNILTCELDEQPTNHGY